MQRAPACRVRWNEWRVKSRERRRGWGVDAARPQRRAEARESWGLVGQRKDDWSECGFCSRNFRKPVGGLGGGPVEEDARTGTQGCQKAEQRLSWRPLRELAESLRQHQGPDLSLDVRRARQRLGISAPASL